MPLQTAHVRGFDTAKVKPKPPQKACRVVVAAIGHVLSVGRTGGTMAARSVVRKITGEGVFRLFGEQLGEEARSLGVV